MFDPPSHAPVRAPRAMAFMLLALANLFWAGNWVIGRALRDDIDPVTLNFWRWLLAALVLAPFALPGIVAQRALIRRSAVLIAQLALTGVVLFQLLVYVGLHTTTAVNGVLLNSSAPLFFMLCSWVMERERATRGQVSGMLVSFAGILIILARGDAAHLREVEFHAGDGWVLLAMAIWGVYSVLLKRREPALGGVLLLFLTAATGVVLMLPLLLWGALHLPAPAAFAGWSGLRVPVGQEIAAVLYIALGASVAAFMCWNRGVAVLGANAAGVSLHLLPAFGTILAIIFLGERFEGFHAAGIATILVGVVLASRAAPQRVAT